MPHVHPQHRMMGGQMRFQGQPPMANMPRGPGGMIQGGSGPGPHMLQHTAGAIGDHGIRLPPGARPPGHPPTVTMSASGPVVTTVAGSKTDRTLLLNEQPLLLEDLLEQVGGSL